ncbi:MAG: BMP family ABC transporter substrate-binding protein [Candidatus Hermodarchaeota archaeon]
MKSQHRKVLLVLFILTSLNSLNFNNTVAENQLFQKIALIIDSTEFYDVSFINDIIEGFNYVNQTYGIDYDLFQLENYDNIAHDPYTAIYYHNNTVTNHTELVKSIIETQEYDLIVLVGYELRRGFLDYSKYPGLDFLYYDLSGELPSDLKKNELIPQNLLIVNFKENELGYIAGALTTAVKTSLPPKIAMVGSFRGDPRTNQLIAGFQSAIFRNASDTQMLISYINDFANESIAKTIANNIKDGAYGLIFTALQNTNTQGILETFSNSSVISVDVNRQQSILKNNTKAILHLFKEFNQSNFFSGTYTFGIEDDVFYPSDWGDIDLVNKTMENIYQDIVEEKVSVPTDIVIASNTSGFEYVITIIVFISIPMLIKLTNKRRKV